MPLLCHVLNVQKLSSMLLLRLCGARCVKLLLLSHAVRLLRSDRCTRLHIDTHPLCFNARTLTFLELRLQHGYCCRTIGSDGALRRPCRGRRTLERR